LAATLFVGLALSQEATAHDGTGWQYHRHQFTAVFHNPNDASDVRYGYADAYYWYYNGHYHSEWNNSQELVNRWVAQGWHYEPQSSYWTYVGFFNQ
jgi:hypothetical protein